MQNIISHVFLTILDEMWAGRLDRFHDIHSGYYIDFCMHVYRNRESLMSYIKSVEERLQEARTHINNIQILRIYLFFLFCMSSCFLWFSDERSHHSVQKSLFTGLFHPTALQIVPHTVRLAKHHGKPRDRSMSGTNSCKSHSST